MKGNTLDFIMIVIFAIIIALMTGCSTYTEYHEDGTIKKEFDGCELSDQKTFSIITITIN